MSLSHLRRLIEQAPEKVGEELDHIEALVQRAIRESRLLLFELRPLVLETRGLGAALEAHISRLNESTHGPPVHLELPERLPFLAPLAARTLFAIIQEAINNARKHAKGATGIWVTVSVEDEWLDVEIRDDGEGFDLKAVESRYEELGSLGLVNMKERAELIDAQFRLQSEPGKGTRVLIRVPLTSHVLIPRSAPEQLDGLEATS
ncbi:MAG: ATP-binding protein [Ardenticatenia bacterium]|nr:ATP-binding protein [Ardenticatenia bacterium]